jgi:hypothetical protein
MLSAFCARLPAIEIILNGDDFDDEAVEQAPPLPEGALYQTGPQGRLSKVALSPDGALAAGSGGDGKVRIWKTDGAKLDKEIAAHTPLCCDARFSPDGKTIFTGGGSSGRGAQDGDKTARAWDVETGKQVRSFEGHEGDVRSVACAPNGLRLATTDSKGIRVWDLKTGKQLNLITGHTAEGATVPDEWTLHIDALVFAPDSRTIVTEANDVTARVWDAVSGKELRMIPNHDGAEAAVALSPDGSTVVSTRAGASFNAIPRLRVWELATGTVLRTIQGHHGYIICVAFTPDGRYVLSGSYDRTLRQWEVDSGVEVRRFNLSTRPRSVACAPNGRTAVTVSVAEGLAVWDLTAPPKAAPIAAPIGTLDEAWQKLASAGYEERTAAFNYYLSLPAAQAAADLQRRLASQIDNPAARAAQRALIAKLDDPSYAVRTQAADELAQLGDAARAELAAAADHPSPEVRTRVASLLNAIGGPADTRTVLAVEVLSYLTDPAAKAELARLAGSGLPCAAHAKAVLKRVEGH